MNLVLPSEIQSCIDRRVRSGEYASAEDVIAAAVTNLDQQERISRLDASDLEMVHPRIKEDLAAGLAAARAGRLSDGEEFFAELEREDRELDEHDSTSG
jgi:Arc/MetJ-type ribon-helix-helix transcriptional regulator